MFGLVYIHLTVLLLQSFTLIKLVRVGTADKCVQTQIIKQYPRKVTKLIVSNNEGEMNYSCYVRNKRLLLRHKLEISMLRQAKP